MRYRSIVELTNVRAAALDQVIELELQRGDLTAWRDNMTESVGKIKTDLTARRVLLHTKLTLPYIVNGIVEFKLIEFAAEIDQLRIRVARLRRQPLPLQQAMRDVLTAIEFLESLQLFASTKHDHWPDEYIDSLEGGLRTVTCPDLIAVRRLRGCASFQKYQCMHRLVDALTHQVHWLEDLMATAFGFRDALVASRLCTEVATDKLTIAQKRLREVDLQDSLQQATAALAEKELEVRIELGEPPTPPQQLHPRGTSGRMRMAWLATHLNRT